MMFNEDAKKDSFLIDYISSVSTKGKDPFAKIKVVIKLDYGVIMRLQHRFPGNEDEEINFLLDKNLENSFCDAILTYKKRIKIRKDVLTKLKAIADLIQNQSLYPNLRKQHVEDIVKNVLGDKVDRVMSTYMKTIDSYIFSSEGKHLSNSNDVNFENFVKTVYDKVDEIL